MRIAFATSADHPELTADDLLAARALEARGVRVEPLVWTEPAVGPAPDAVVIRSCWDYHLRAPQFRDWLGDLDAAGVPVLNPGDLVRWNLHKSYMSDLAARGVPIVPTVHVGATDPHALSDVLHAAGWARAVVKPAVSASAWETWRADAPIAPGDDERFARLRARGDLLVQCYVEEVTTGGEWSLVFFGRTFSHAVRKLPRTGDFRVQTEHGGSVVVEPPPAAVVDAAARALAALPVTPIYCRIDGVVADGAFLLMEAECIDPVLFFGEHPPAAAAFADEVLARTFSVVPAGG